LSLKEAAGMAQVVGWPGRGAGGSADLSICGGLADRAKCGMPANAVGHVKREAFTRPKL
jgi:hypothetical protein